MPDVAVCVPWVDVRCTWRERAKAWTQAFWASLGAEVVYGIDDSRPVNRARARNRAAERTDAEILFFSDADTWVPPEQFHQACERAAETDRLILAYVSHVRLTRSSTEHIYAGTMTLLGQSITGCSSGAIAVSRRTFDAVGGHDERFTGWGYEDRCFQFACDTIAGPGERIQGRSYHLWHPRGTDQMRTTAERKQGEALALRYKRAAGERRQAGIVRAVPDAVRDPNAMRALLSEPGGPLMLDRTTTV